MNFNVLGLTCDGGSRIVCEFANGLIARGHAASITSLTDLNLAWMDYAPLHRDVSVKVTKPTLLMRMFRKAFLTRRGWNYNLKEVLTHAIPDCDVNVAAHSLLALPTLLSGKGKPVLLIQAYEPKIQYYSNPYLARESEFAYHLPMKKLCTSESLAKMVNGINIGNGIDLGLYKQLPIKKLRGSVMGINTRRAIFWKNAALLDKVFVELRRRGYQILSPQRGTPDTVFVKFYNLASIYVFLSLKGYEGFGSQPLESMASGTAVVTSPSVPYVHHMENAFVLPDKPAVSDVVGAVEMLENDELLRNRLVKNGLETARQFDLRNVIDNFVKEVSNT